MKITKTYIFLLLLFCSCSYRQNRKTEETKSESGTDSFKISSLTTAYKFPILEIPDNYFLDSIMVYDTISKAKYTAYYPQSHLEELRVFSLAILEDVKNQISIEQSYVEPYNGDLTANIIFSYQLRPIEIYSDSQVISICNIIDTYTKGGNHHNHTWHTFNYNLRTNQLIKFADVFQLQSKTDSTKFISFSEEHVIENGCTGWGWPYEYLDFSFTNNGIYINPNLSWACITTRSLLPVNTENEFLKKEWVK